MHGERMNRMTIFRLAAALTVGLSAGLNAQQVYRCELADGSTIFSDLPCRSDIGREDVVDATHHQGHRASSRAQPPAAPSRSSAHSGDDRSGNRTGSRGGREKGSLTRNERLSLERRRKELLSALKRRHLDPRRRRALIDKLRAVDRKLGIEPEDVPDMPFHNREVYEDNPVFRR